jgi:hypothetical protein
VNKRATIAATAFLFILAGTALADSKTERLARIRKLVAKQRSGLTWTWNELQAAKGQIALVANERDNWKAYGDDQYQQHMNAEVRVAKEQKKILQLYIILGVIGLLAGAYAYLHFGYHVIP